MFSGCIDLRAGSYIENLFAIFNRFKNCIFGVDEFTSALFGVAATSKVFRIDIQLQNQKR